VLDAGWHVSAILACARQPAGLLHPTTVPLGDGVDDAFLNPEFWKSTLTVMQKVAYLSGMMYYWATALGIFMNPVLCAVGLGQTFRSPVVQHRLRGAEHPHVACGDEGLVQSRTAGWSVTAVQNYAHPMRSDKPMGMGRGAHRREQQEVRAF
jgi:hypothetical protein